PVVFIGLIVPGVTRSINLCSYIASQSCGIQRNDTFTAKLSRFQACSDNCITRIGVSCNGVTNGHSAELTIAVIRKPVYNICPWEVRGSKPARLLLIIIFFAFGKNSCYNKDQDYDN